MKLPNKLFVFLMVLQALFCFAFSQETGLKQIFTQNEKSEDSSYYKLLKPKKPHQLKARSQVVSLNEDAALAIELSVHPSGQSQPITYTVVTAPLHGSLTGTGSARVYTPVANYNGPDSFTFYISDGVQSSANATVNITVLPVNDAPVAVTELITANSVSNSGVYSTTPVLADVLANDTDLENNPLTIVNVSTPSHGTAVIQSNKILYTATLGYSGVDSFNYTISDGQLTANVMVSVNVYWSKT